MITFENGFTDPMTRDDVVADLKFMLGNNPFCDTLELLGMWESENGKLSEADFNAIATQAGESNEMADPQDSSNPFQSQGSSMSVLEALNFMDCSGRVYLKDVQETSGLDDVELKRQLQELEMAEQIVLYSLNDAVQYWPAGVKEGFSISMWPTQEMRDHRRILYVTR